MVFVLFSFWELDWSLFSQSWGHHYSLVEWVVVADSGLVSPPILLREHFFDVFVVVQKDLPIVRELVLRTLSTINDRVLQGIPKVLQPLRVKSSERVRINLKSQERAQKP